MGLARAGEYHEGMTPARKLGCLRFVHSAIALSAGFGLLYFVYLFIPSGPINPMLAVAGFLFFIGCFAYFIWPWLIWKPVCPNCRTSRARFVYPDGHNEHLVCLSCGFDEPTGFERGGG